jgi:hypothetical protein
MTYRSVQSHDNPTGEEAAFRMGPTMAPIGEHVEVVDVPLAG